MVPGNQHSRTYNWVKIGSKRLNKVSFINERKSNKGSTMDQVFTFSNFALFKNGFARDEGSLFIDVFFKFHKRHFFMMYTKIVHGNSFFFQICEIRSLFMNNFVIDVNPLVQF